MTQKEVRRRNGLAFALLGVVFIGLGIFDLQAGKNAAGIAYFVAGAAALQVPAGMIRRRRHGGKG